MVTYYNRKDVVSFGNYLLSEERKNLIVNHPMSTTENIPRRLVEVSHADVENWKQWMINKRKHPIDS